MLFPPPRRRPAFNKFRPSVPTPLADAQRSYVSDALTNSGLFGGCSIFNPNSLIFEGQRAVLIGRVQRCLPPHSTQMLGRVAEDVSRRRYS